MIEDLQRKCCQIILGSKSTSYAANLEVLELERLDERRKRLMGDFAVKCLASSKHSWWFTRHPKFSTKTRTEFPRLLIPRLRRERQEK